MYRPICDSRALETQRMGPFPQMRKMSSACSAGICYTHGADQCNLTCCKSSVDDNMLRTPAHQSLLRLIVHTGFMTDIPTNIIS